jgi:hypothetical protein
MHVKERAIAFLLLFLTVACISEVQNKDEDTELLLKSSSTSSLSLSPQIGTIANDDEKNQLTNPIESDASNENVETIEIQIESSISSSSIVEQAIPTRKHAPRTKEFGTEVSWPMQQHLSADEDSELLLSQQQYESYNQYMQGCYDKYDKELCDKYENERISNNAFQPLCQHNFTSNGYAKARLPASIHEILQSFWKENFDKDRIAELESEYWDFGNTMIHTNHWDTWTKLLSLNGGSTTSSSRMRSKDQQIILEYVQNILEKWTGVPLIPTSMHGIRVYQNGSILTPHVDR